MTVKRGVSEQSRVEQDLEEWLASIGLKEYERILQDRWHLRGEWQEELRERLRSEWQPRWRDQPSSGSYDWDGLCKRVERGQGTPAEVAKVARVALAAAYVAYEHGFGGHITVWSADPELGLENWRELYRELRDWDFYIDATIVKSRKGQSRSASLD